MNASSRELEKDKIKPKMDDPKQDGKLRKILVFVGKLFKVLLYLICIIPIMFFWWSFIAIILGYLIYALTKNPTWKLYGMMLAFITGLATFLVETVFLLAFVLGAVILLAYMLGVFFVSVGGWFYRKIRKRPLPKWFSLTYLGKKIPKKTRPYIKLVFVITPIVFWAVVSIDLGVMFDNNAQFLWVHAPSTVTIGEEFPINVQAWDRYERISGNYHGTVEFSIKSYNLTTLELINSPDVDLPESYSFTGQKISQGLVPAYQISNGKDNGRHIFPVQINTPGIHYILVNDSQTGNVYWSNPIVVKNFTSSDWKLYWGDLHSHTILSDGSGTPQHSFDFARYIACLDYVSVTDHGEDLSVWGFIPNWFFDILEDAANEAYEPGQFVSLQGVEWTSHYPPSFFIDYGHYVCIFSGDEIPRIASNWQNSPEALWNALDEYCNDSGEQALAIPHHTIRNDFIQDWTYLNPKYVKLAEVSSVHGECLFEGDDPLNYKGSVNLPSETVHGSCIMDAFKMGYQITLCASGDNHDGHPGHSISHTDAYIGHQWPFAIDHSRNGHIYPSGLTAVWSNDLTRDGIFTALSNQYIFANSDYGRPILNFSINGISVGDGSTVFVATNTTQRNISIFVAQDGAPAPGITVGASVTPNWMPNWNATIEVFKNGLLWNSTVINTPIIQLDMTDDSLILGTSYNWSIELNGQDYINRFSDNPINILTLNTGGMDFYLVRVTGTNGRTSYVGPIWVEPL